MDNLAHTLVGAALGYAGLKSRTGLGMATLMISANLPDIDVLGIPFGETLAWRRGWTHGPISSSYCRSFSPHVLLRMIGGRSVEEPDLQREALYERVGCCFQVISGSSLTCFWTT